MKLIIGRRSDWSVEKKRENGSIGAPEELLLLLPLRSLRSLRLPLPLTLVLGSPIVSSSEMMDPVLGPLLDGRNGTVPPVVNSPAGDPWSNMMGESASTVMVSLVTLLAPRKGL